MSHDTSLPVRRAMLIAAKADGLLTALVPAERIFPEQPPAQPDWPFIKYGQPQQLPLRASGLDGSTINVAMHGHAKGPGADLAYRIGGALSAALDGLELPLEGGVGTAYVQHTGSQLLQDPDEASAWHAVVNFAIEVAS